MTGRSGPGPLSGQTIGIVGVGLCGSAMADRLLPLGVRLVAYDVSADALRGVVARGARGVGSAAEVVREADRVILSLPDSPDVLQAVEGAGGLLSAERLPAAIVDTTTGDPGEAALLGRRLATRGVAYVEACISGSSGQLRAGEAVLLVGGHDADVAKVDTILQAVSPRILRVGPPGSGAKAKLLTNLVLGLNRLVLAEGLAFGRVLGLDPELCLKLVRETPAYSAAADVKGERMVRREYRPEARVRQHRKDLELMLRQLAPGGHLPLAEIHAAILDRLIAAGAGDLDNSAVFEIMLSSAQGEQP